MFKGALVLIRDKQCCVGGNSGIVGRIFGDPSMEICNYFTIPTIENSVG